MSAITIDLGGTTIKTGVIEKGILLAKAKIKAQADKTIEENLQQAYECVEKLLQPTSISRQQISAVGISFPGIVNTTTNEVLSEYVKYKNANQFDFNKWANEKWNLPVVVENDAKAALLGEWKYGAGKNYIRELIF